MKRSVMFVRFPYGRRDEPDTTDWLVETVIKARADERVLSVLHSREDDTPITMTRNLAVEKAKAAKVDVLVMIDNDMKPDAYHHSNINRLGTEALAKPFWYTAFDFLCEHHGPCMIAAPYCGPGPTQMPYVFKWCNQRSDHPSPDYHLEMFTREEAAVRSGIEEVGALATGLIMIDMRAFDRMKPPYFFYEWTDKTESQKASTEDVVVSRDAAFNGVKLYSAWDCWAGHWKWQCIGKPRLTTIDSIKENIREGILRNQPSDEKLTFVRNGVIHGEKPTLEQV